jgi:hypothetical protein
MKIQADELRRVVGVRSYNAILKHEWLAKFVKPIPPDTVQFVLSETDTTYIVQCSSDGKRMLSFSISKSSKKVGAPSLFLWKGQYADSRKLWIYKSTYKEEE